MSDGRRQDTWKSGGAGKPIWLEWESPCCREPKSLSWMIKALTVYLVYYELKSATINDSINQSIPWSHPARTSIGLVCGWCYLSNDIQKTVKLWLLNEVKPHKPSYRGKNCLFISQLAHHKDRKQWHLQTLTKLIFLWLGHGINTIKSFLLLGFYWISLRAQMESKNGPFKIRKLLRSVVQILYIFEMEYANVHSVHWVPFENLVFVRSSNCIQ